MNVDKTLISVPFAAALLQFVSSSIKNDTLSSDHRPQGELNPFSEGFAIVSISRGIKYFSGSPFILSVHNLFGLFSFLFHSHCTWIEHKVQ